MDCVQWFFVHATVPVHLALSIRGGKKEKLSATSRFWTARSFPQRVLSEPPLLCALLILGVFAPPSTLPYRSLTASLSLSPSLYLFHRVALRMAGTKKCPKAAKKTIAVTKPKALPSPRNGEAKESDASLPPPPSPPEATAADTLASASTAAASFPLLTDSALHKSAVKDDEPGATSTHAPGGHLKRSRENSVEAHLSLSATAADFAPATTPVLAALKENSEPALLPTDPFLLSEPSVTHCSLVHSRSDALYTGGVTAYRLSNGSCGVFFHGDGSVLQLMRVEASEDMKVHSGKTEAEGLNKTKESRGASETAAAAEEEEEEPEHKKQHHQPTELILYVNTAGHGFVFTTHYFPPLALQKRLTFSIP